MTPVPFLCRDGFHRFEAMPGPAPCPVCDSRRTVGHAELVGLTIAHMDCDAFYATIEKRDDPGLKDKPLIIGGTGGRGVVSTACYIARLSGVRSAMPMYQARKLCPDAVVLMPDMRKYKEVGLQVRAMMARLTPLVEPVSIDEAFMDLSGTERLHGAPPAVMLARLAAEIEREIGITISVGLAPNKFLAKLASDMQKPRGFTVIGESDAKTILAALPISRIYGVGAQMAAKLQKDGLTMISQLQGMDESRLVRRYGDMGSRLYHLARGEDRRRVSADQPVKSVSSEITLDRDLADFEALEDHLWRQAERTSEGLKKKNLAALTITLKLKTSMHRTVTRSRTLDAPTQLAETLFEVGRDMLKPLADGTPYRLIGIGGSQFRPPVEADQPDLIDPGRTKRATTERALDALRAKFGRDAIGKGRTLPAKNAANNPDKKSK
ncbi:DNA polymerase IV [Gimibacter soli]|uniref:DNA polymerase IV n=1 Tax=Gimibacter soli TaxID=3024400 RepID=A0AAF0BNA5_9PROT|nr:DNA polymerase IV [Gimibacter soli]WCL55696.1 DNA polymerase IV [Gimibacter soli]